MIVYKPFQVLLRVLLLQALVCSFVGAPESRAQEPSPSPTITPQTIDRIALHQALVDLTSPWTVMCVAAHPDDEDGTTLTILRRKYGVHTMSLFSTYGEGGQNAVGPDLYEDLGVIRAHETMEAARIQGSEPYFLGLKDFGFSKSADEAFRMWGHDEALRRMVLKIRELRPDVIITNHDTTSGHGHHQATGRLILEAFDAAADPKRFPEQLGRLSVWQPLRLFVRARSAGETEELVTMDPNDRDPVRGTSYAEQALTALQQHATQGPWPKTIAERLRGQTNTSGRLPLIRYALVRAAPGTPTLSKEAGGFLDGLSLEGAVSARLDPPAINGQPLTEFIDKTDRVLNALIDWRRRRQPTAETSGPGAHRVQLMTDRGSRALALAAGVKLTVNSRNVVLVPGVPANFLVNLSNAGDRAVQIKSLSFEGWNERKPLDAAELLSADTETSSTVDRITPTGAAVTVPHTAHLYEGRLFGERFGANADLEIDGVKFSLSAETNLDVAPAVEIKSISPTPYVWTLALLKRPFALRVKLLNNLAVPFRGTVKISGPQYRIFEVGREITLEPNESREVTLQSNAIPIETSTAARHGRESTGQLLLSIEETGAPAHRITERFFQVNYSDARVASGLQVGYLPSFDKTIEQSLAALGVSAKELNVDDIQKTNLTGYSTIIIDNRGYQAHPELLAANPRLLDYVQNGGTLVVFYHKDNEWNPNPGRGRPQLAPYPIILGGERVTEETAPIKFIEPAHPLLNSPNRIAQADFDKWVQERGLYYPKEWDPHYQALFATADEGEAPLRGGLLVARYGRGNYIYTSMVWYRQLAAGLPGAYRMFANMISYGHWQKPRTRRQRRAPSQIQVPPTGEAVKKRNLATD